MTTIPADILCAADYARLAEEMLPPPLFAHVEGGSGHDRTARANREALDALAIVPRLLRDVRAGNTTTRLGTELLPHPILLAPVGSQAALHPGAERETARAAAATGTRMIVSTQSTLTLEALAGVAGADRWFQLYWQPDRATNADLLARAERAGYGAIVLTLDTPLQMPSFAAQRLGYQPPADIAANLAGYPPAPRAEGNGLLGGRMAGAPTIEDIDWLLAQTRLPLWIKGVLHPEDAVMLRGRGAAGLIVSNHGGRTLDGVPASLSMLSACRAAVGAEIPLLFDGGIRSGTDVFRAIASGADAVLIGRLQAYAVAVAGALGVAHMLKLLREELEYCMAMAGCASLADVRAATLVPMGADR